MKVSIHIEDNDRLGVSIETGAILKDTADKNVVEDVLKKVCEKAVWGYALMDDLEREEGEKKEPESKREAWKERALEELKELRGRINKLQVFVDTNGEHVSDLHRRQLVSMMKYEEILSTRCKEEGWEKDE